MRMTQAAFAALVVETIDSLPDRFVAALDNVEFVVEDRPTPRQVADLAVAHADELLGLYEGMPRTALGDAGMRVPDRVTIYRLALLARARSESELRAQVRRTVLHEIAHVFGIDDDRLVELGAY